MMDRMVDRSFEYVLRRPSSRIRKKCWRDSVDGFQVKLERIRPRLRAENKEKKNEPERMNIFEKKKKKEGRIS